MAFKNITIDLGKCDVFMADIERDLIYEATKKSARTHTSRLTEND